MNERIRELMLEAGYAAPEMAERAHKLAELIVKRCINIANEYDKPKLYGPGLAIACDIESHFDICVEEDGEDEDEDEEMKYRCPKCNEEWSGTSCGINDCGWITGVKE